MKAVCAGSLFLCVIRSGYRSLDQQIVEICIGERLCDSFCCMPVAVWIGHACEACAESGTECLLNRCQNRVGIGNGIECIARSFAALLAYAHIDCWQGEGRGF